MKKLTLFIALLLLCAQTAFAGASETIYVSVNGLVCDFCAVALEKVFGKQESVENIKVNLDNALVIVKLKQDGTLDDATLKQLVLDSGYHVTEIKRQVKNVE